MTGRDLVTEALKLIGSYAPGESLDASDAQDGLSTINRMIDSWSTEGLLIFAETRETPLTLTPGTATVTMGTSGDITTRPMAISRALLRDETSSPAAEYPIHILTLARWTEIIQKDTQSDYPTDLYDDGGYPQRTLTLYPVPSASHKLVLFTMRPLTTIASLDTSLSLPPGYERALVFNGAIELAPGYGRPVPDIVMDTAFESKASIKRANHRQRLLEVDPALRPRPAFNILTGWTR